MFQALPLCTHYGDIPPAHAATRWRPCAFTSHGCFSACAGRFGGPAVLPLVGPCPAWRAGPRCGRCCARAGRSGASAVPFVGPGPAWRAGHSPSQLGWRTPHARCVACALALGSGSPLAWGVAPRGRLEPCHAYTSGWALSCVCTRQHSLLSGQCWRLLSLRACPRARARAKAAPLLWPGLAWPVYNGH